MAQLMMHANVLKHFYKLPTKVQKKVSSFFTRFEQNPWDPSIGLHALKATMLDEKVRGADLPDGYRAIVVAPEKGDTFLLVHIDSHNRAYDWAKNKRFEVHGSTGAFQIFDDPATSTPLTPKILSNKPDSTEEYSTENYHPINKLTDEELFHAGVPKPLIPAVRKVHYDYQLEALATYLPPECAEVLIGIASGLSLDESLMQVMGNDITETTTSDVAGPGDFSQLSKRMNRDLVIIDGEEHLKAIFQGGSLEEWRVFLHPRQLKVVEWQVNGPMSITGAAGTGKTVALMHRAVHLARQLEHPKDKILVITFTTNLAITIKNYINQMAPTLAERIETTHLNQLARTICIRGGWKGRIVSPSENEELWDEVWADPACTNLPMTKPELKKEFDLVVDANGVTSEETYLTTVRTGRPRMGRKQRREAWPVFQAYRRLLLKRNLMTFEGAVHQARLVVENASFPKYRHVLADEVQDFSLESLRLLASLSPIQDALTNPLTVAGDGHQRIYRTKVPLSRAGIEVRGRSSRLKVNYRTSAQIRSFAESILKGVDVDDLDSGITTTVGDSSVFTGPDPNILNCSDAEEEARHISAWVKDLVETEEFAPHEICITPYKPQIVKALASENLKHYELRDRQADPGQEEPGVRLGSMKRIKGLEFRVIVMACFDQTDAMNNLTSADIIDRCERYVAATRARERLLICVHSSPSK